MKSGSDKTQWGVAGLGNVASKFFAPAMSRSSRSELAACVDVNPESARKFADTFAVSKVCGDFDEMVNDPEIDAVYLATPNSLHYPQVKQALQAGKDVLCEKPLSLSLEHGTELVNIANEAKRLLHVSFQFRFEQLFMHLRDLISSGEMGEIRSIRLFGCAAVANPAPGWRQTPQEGGIFADLAVHFMDLVPWLTGLEFSDISARVNPADVDANPNRTITVLGTLGTSCHAVIGAGREVAGGQNNLTIEGTKKSAAVATWRGAAVSELVLQDREGRTVETMELAPIFEREIAAFEDEREGKTTELATSMDGIRGIVLADAIFESIKTGRVVDVTNWRDSVKV